MLFPSLQKHKKFIVGIFVFVVVATSAFSPLFARPAQAVTIGGAGAGFLAGVAVCTAAALVSGGILGLLCGAAPAVVAALGIAAGVHTLATGVTDIIMSLLFIPIIISSWILGLAGTLLSWVTQYTIVDIALHLNSISGINIAWGVIRDLINISFIFILLYTAINVILNRGADMKKIITGVVLAAILINFSLFFAKVIIDTSNLVAITFHNAIVTTCAGPDSSGVTKISDEGECFMKALNISSIYSNGSSVTSITNNTTDSSGQAVTNTTASDFSNTDQGKQEFNNVTQSYSGAAVYSIGGSIFILTTAFVFFAVSLMLIIRYIIIIFLLILSPVMVMGELIPALGAYSKQWWDELWEQAIFAPLFFLLCWINFQIILSPGFIKGLGTGPTALSHLLAGAAPQSNVFSSAGNAGPLDTAANFVIIIGLMIVTLIISKKFSKRGGEMGSHFAGKIIGGATGVIGRQTIGRATNALAESRAFNAMADKKGVGGFIARKALGGTKNIAGSTFDARSSYLGKTMGAGPAAAGGFTERKKQDEKARREAGERVRQIDQGNIIAAGAKAGATPDEIRAMQQQLATMTSKEVEAIVLSKKELLKSMAFAQAISVRQLDALNKSTELSEDEKDSIKGERFRTINDAMTPATGTRTATMREAEINRAGGAIKALSDEELDMLDRKHFEDRDFVRNLRAAQVEYVTTKSKEFIGPQKKAIGDLRLSENNRMIGADPSKIIDMDLKEIGKLDMNILADINVLSRLSIRKLKRLRDELKDAQADMIRTEITSGPTPVGATPAETAKLANQKRLSKDWLEVGKGAPGEDDEF